jgi:hypothetical protein
MSPGNQVRLNAGWNMMTALTLKAEKYRISGDLRAEATPNYSRNYHRNQRTMRFGVLIHAAISIITVLFCVADNR